MLAQDIIVNAYTQAGLIETGDPTSSIHTMGLGGLALTGEVPTVVIDIAMAALNRWYRYAWQRYPHRDIRIANVTVAVAAGAVTVELPTDLDVIRSVRVAGGALLPLSEIREADFAAVYADAPGTPAAYVQLADGLTADEIPAPCRRIRLAPVPAAPLTLQVNGLRRFVPLGPIDAPLLPKFEDALFFYVLAELHGYAKDAVQQKAALALAGQHFENALACETGVEACDDVCIPLQSFANG